ncbi:MAG TPA: four helix bundle protein, partial [Verrucomicrobiae bacterium]|nr:four helix bundle protein [Verrucomicrobiae bacterium]
MAQLNSFRDLNVYQLAREQARKIFEITRTFPSEEKYSLTDQIRRSSRSVNAMIAEAWARRPYIAVFTNKIGEALGETMETQAWLDHSLDCHYITLAQHRPFNAAWQSIGAMLNQMMARAESFCPNS